MTHEETLKQAIDKAMANGFDITLVGDWQPYEDYRDAKYILFSHHFAKAFWGNCECSDQQVLPYEDPTRRLKHWQYHLQQMVLEEHPVQYVEKFI